MSCDGRDRCGRATRLRVESEVLDVRVSNSKPDRGFAKVRMTTFNQNDEAVQIMVANLLVPHRPRN